MFKKIVLSLAAALASAVFPFQSQAVEAQFVYVENLSLRTDRTTFNQGERIEGTFVLRNAGDRDAGDVYYNVILAKIESSRPDVESYAIVTEEKFGPVAIAAKSKSVSLPFALELPFSSSGEKFEVKVEALSSTGVVLSWADSTSFAISGSVAPSEAIALEDAYIELNDTTKHRLQTGPTIYADKDPRIASFVAQIKNPSAQKSQVEVVAVASRWPFGQGSEPLYSDRISVSIDPKSTSQAVVALPTHNYVPGVYEGKAYFRNASGEEVMPAVNFRYIVGGESATVHSLSVSKSVLEKDEEFSVMASVTGTPFDVNSIPSEDAKSGSNSQDAVLSLTVLNEDGTIIAESVQEANLKAGTQFEFSLTASKAAKALKAVLNVEDKTGKLLATYESNLSANYDSLSGNLVKSLAIYLSLAAVILFALWLIIRHRRALRNIKPKASVAAAIFIAGTLVALSLVAPTSRANHTQWHTLYNSDPTKGFVYADLMSYHEGEVHTGTGGTWSWTNFITRTDTQTSYTVNVPIDAEYEVGSPFTIAARVKYALCGNQPQSLHLGSLASSETTPADETLGIDVIKESNGMTKEQLWTLFTAKYRTFLEYNRYPATNYVVCTAPNSPRGCYSTQDAANAARESAIVTAINATRSTFDSTAAQFVTANGKLKRTDEYIEPLGFNDPVWEGYSGGYLYYNYSKQVTAPLTPGVHKFWIGSLTSIHKDSVNVAVGIVRQTPGYVSITRGDPVSTYYERHGWRTDMYLKIKGYQTYKVLPPSPETITFDPNAGCGKIGISWTRKAVYADGQVDSYKLYRKIDGVDNDYKLISSSVPGAENYIDGTDTSYTDTINSVTVGTASYRIVAHHDASGLDSNPIEGSTSFDFGSTCNSAKCGTQDGKNVGVNYNWNPGNNGANITDPELCEIGHANPDRPVADANGVYNWMCEATGTDVSLVDATCRAYTVQPPTCGTSGDEPTDTMSSWPNGDVGLCAVGDAADKNFSLSQNRYQWSCQVERVGEVDCYANKPPTVPSTPTNLTATGSCGSSEPGKNTIALTFKSTEGSAPASFIVYRETSATGSFDTPYLSPVAAEVNADGDLEGDFYDPYADPGVTYYYKVSATNAAGTSAKSATFSDDTPATCTTVTQCGPLGNEPTDSMPTCPPQTTLGLCTGGNAVGVVKNSAGTKCTWTCDGPTTDPTCEATISTNVAECGSAISGGPYTTAPGSNWTTLCSKGYADTPRIDPNDSSKYMWICSAYSGPASQTCRASREDTGSNCDTNPALCPSYPTCGNPAPFTSAPNALTQGLCGNGAASGIAPDPTSNGYTWNCSLGGRTVYGCNGQRLVVTPPETCATNPALCPVDGELALNPIKTYPSLVVKGNACAINMAKGGGIFKRIDPATSDLVRCVVTKPNPNESKEYFSYPDLDDEYEMVQQEHVFVESDFKVDCYHVTVAQDGTETIPAQNEWVTSTGTCRINPSHVETSFWDKIWIGFKDMSASAFNAFAKFFNLK